MMDCDALVPANNIFLFAVGIRYKKLAGRRNCLKSYSVELYLARGEKIYLVSWRY